MWNLIHFCHLIITSLSLNLLSMRQSIRWMSCELYFLSFINSLSPLASSRLRRIASFSSEVLTIWEGFEPCFLDLIVFCWGYFTKASCIDAFPVVLFRFFIGLSFVQDVWCLPTCSGKKVLRQCSHVTSTAVFHIFTAASLNSFSYSPWIRPSITLSSFSGRSGGDRLWRRGNLFCSSSHFLKQFGTWMPILRMP